MPGVETDGITSFLNLILSASKDQRLALLRSISSKQGQIIRQVAYNILINSSIPLRTDDRAYLQRNIGILRKLASRRIDIHEKRDILVKKHLLAKAIARIAVNYLR